MNSANPWKKIYNRIGKAAAWGQLAEEAAELSAIASKADRILRGDNPARMSYGEAEAKATEEIADVFNAIDVLDAGLANEDGLPHLLTYAKRMTFPKMKRWYKDLFGKEETE
jgi:hypothetical protein